jgi:methenyltetrahydrofolate cyclohydrolase
MPDTTVAGSRIDVYLAALASAAATPGGGAAAGLTAAQAAALLAMVCNLSRGRRYAAVAEDVEAIHDDCVALRDQLLALADADAAAFGRLMAAQRLPHDSGEERTQRTFATQHALKEAAAVPLQLLERAAALLPHANRLATIGNPNLITDIGVALHLIEAAAQSARLNVLINTRTISDTTFVTTAQQKLEATLTAITHESAATLSAVEGILAGS